MPLGSFVQNAFLLSVVLILAAVSGVAIAQYRRFRLLMAEFHKSDSPSAILKTVIDYLKPSILSKFNRCAVLFPDEDLTEIPYFENYSENEVRSLFFLRDRKVIYQSLFNARSVSLGVFGTSVLYFGEAEIAGKIESKLEEMTKPGSDFRFRYLMVPSYEKEIAGLILFESHPEKLFTVKDAKKIQRSLPILKYGLSRAFLLLRVVHQSVTDPVTGLWNKRQFNAMIRKDFELSKRHGRNFTVGVINIDRFREINTQFGYQTGDLVLKEIAVILEENSRKSDFIFRIGGGEFCVILNGLEMGQTETDWKRRLDERMEQWNLNARDKAITRAVTLSAGFASESEAGKWQDVFEQADRRMAAEKAGKRAGIRS